MENNYQNQEPSQESNMTDDIFLGPHPQLPKPRKLIRKYIIFGIIIAIAGVFLFNFGLAYKKITVTNAKLFSRELTGDIFELGSAAPEDIIKSQILPIPKEEADRLDILVLGIRGEDDPDGGLLTDSIMVISLDNESGKTAMISVPRDLFVNMENVFTGKVNGIYWTGLFLGKDFNYIKNTFSRILGIYIDKVVVFDFDSFNEVIDTIDGIDIILDEPFQETLQWGYEFYLPEGKNHLEGEDALYYVRSRYSTDDFDRARRQQQVILAIKDKVLSLGILGNPLKITNLVSSLSEAVSTDLNIWDVNDLIDLSNSIGATDNPPKRFVLDTTNALYHTTEFDAYILLPNLNDYKEIHKVFKGIL